MLLPENFSVFVQRAPKKLLADKKLGPVASRCFDKFEVLDIPAASKLPRGQRRRLAEALVYGIYALEAYATDEGRRAPHRWYRYQARLPQHPHWKRINIELRKAHGGRYLSRIKNLLFLGFLLQFGKEQASMPLLRPLAPILYLILHGRTEPDMSRAEDVCKQIRARINRLEEPLPVDDARDLFLVISDYAMKPI